MRATMALALTLSCAAWSVFSADIVKEESPKPTTSVSTAAREQTSAGQPGVRVYVDPATGRRTANPTAEQRRAAAAQDALNTDFGNDAAFETETLPSGAVILHTHGKNQSVVMAKPGADGRAVIQCNDATHLGLGQHAHDLPATETTERDVR